MKSLRIYLVLLLCCSGMATLHAQDNTTGAGGEAAGSGGTVSYSVGQIVYTTETGTTGTVAQGVEQPYEISIVTGDSVPQITLALSSYPNPAGDYVNLKIEEGASENLSYRLYDGNGHLLESKTITGSEVQLFMGNLAAASYYLQIVRNDELVKTFKILKNQ